MPSLRATTAGCSSRSVDRGTERPYLRRASGSCSSASIPRARRRASETFAIGAESETQFRMTGLALGPKGSLYVADDTNELIWRIVARATAGS